MSVRSALERVRWSPWLALLVSLSLALAAPAAAAPLDLDGLRAAVVSCDDGGLMDSGVPNAALCDPVSTTSLDLPLDPGASQVVRTRAGAFHPSHYFPLVRMARSAFDPNDADGLLMAPFLSVQEDALVRTLRASGNAADAAQADAIVAGTSWERFDELLAARADRDRLADLTAGLPFLPGGADTVSEASLAADLPQVSLSEPLAGLSRRFGLGTLSLRALPLFVGPDGIANTADDLPYVINNPRAAPLGFARGEPIAGGLFDGGTVFRETVRVDVPSPDGSGLETVEVYGSYSDFRLAQFGCLLAFRGELQPDLTCLVDGVDVTEFIAEAGCFELQSRSQRFVGINADGDCMQMNGFAHNHTPLSLFPLLALRDLRPVEAVLEPGDLTDFLRVSRTGAALFARPRSPSGAVDFGPTAGRRLVDPLTGALLRTGGERCRYRAPDGSPTPDRAASAGPNGVVGDADDVLPTVGDCLIWSDDGTALRDSAEIAASHPVDQQLFHTLCTLGFDEDTGGCPFDVFTIIEDSELFAQLLGAKPGIVGVGLPGVDTIRRRAAPFEAELSPIQIDALMTSPGSGFGDALTDISTFATPTQQALIGCGPLAGTPCSAPQVLEFLDIEALGGGTIASAIDVMNAAGDVLAMDWVLMKALREDTLVGTFVDPAGGLSYLPGMNVGGAADVEAGEVQQLDTAGRDAIVDSGEKTDGWIEGLPWRVNAFWWDRGVLVYEVANRLETDVRCNAESPHFDLLECERLNQENGGVDPPNDPFDLTNPANEFVSSGGEWCSTAMGAHSYRGGCTVLETVSANFERARIASDLLGSDGVFDPPESFAELTARLNLARGGDPLADPVAGPDGIVGYNVRLFGGPVFDALVVDARLPLSDWLVGPPADGDYRVFVESYDPETCADICFLALDPNDVPTTTQPIVSLPISIPVVVIVDPAGGFGTRRLNLLAIDISNRRRARELVAGRDVRIDDGSLVRIDESIRRELVSRSRFHGFDFDQDGASDLDRDLDGVWDATDDGLGPITDDAILCGSGIPGDTLQEAIQYEFSDPADEIALVAAFPDGLPPRSPVFCPSLTKFLEVIGESRPGKLDFVWHGGAPPPGADVDGNGVYDILELPMCGDTSADSLLGADDAVLLRADLAGIAPGLSPAGVARCSMNADGDCDIADWVVLERTLAARPPGPEPGCMTAVP